MVFRRGQIQRTGCVIQTLEAQVGQFLLGCKCPVSRFLPGLAKDLSAPLYVESNDGMLGDLRNEIRESKWSGLVPTSFDRYCKHPHITPKNLIFRQTFKTRKSILKTSRFVFLKLVYEISPLCTALLDTLIVAQPANEFPYNAVTSPFPDTIMFRYVNIVPTGTLQLH
jgi:hypothetical protein